jgi:hypothetical protein
MNEGADLPFVYRVAVGRCAPAPAGVAHQHHGKETGQRSCAVRGKRYETDGCAGSYVPASDLHGMRKSDAADAPRTSSNARSQVRTRHIRVLVVWPHEGGRRGADRVDGRVSCRPSRGRLCQCGHRLRSTDFGARGRNANLSDFNMWRVRACFKSILRQRRALSCATNRACLQRRRRARWPTAAAGGRAGLARTLGLNRRGRRRPLGAEHAASPCFGRSVAPEPVHT